MKIFIYYEKVKSSKTYNSVFTFYVLCLQQKIGERKNSHGIEYRNGKIMFSWLAEQAFPRVDKLMVNGGLNKEHFGSS